MKQIRFAGYLFLILLSIGFYDEIQASNNALENDNTRRQIIEYLKDSSKYFLEISKGSGLALGIVDVESIDWTYTTGTLNKTSTAEVNNNSVFRLESISKNITTLAILVAVDEGVLSLEKSISEYLPDFNINTQFEKDPLKKITLRHLLSHTTGLSHHAPVGNYHDSNPHTWQEHINSIQNTWLRFPVGTRFDYSNLNIDLAAYILETVTNTKFQDWVGLKVLGPLNMNRTTFNYEKATSFDNHLNGYTADGLHTIQGIIKSPMMASGGCFSTLEDMMKLVKFYLHRGENQEKQIVSKSLLVDEMFDIKFINAGQNGYSFGFDKRAISEENYILSHTGSGYGFRSCMILVPNLNLGIVLLYNSINQNLLSKLKADIDEIIKNNSTNPYVISFQDEMKNLKKVENGDKRIESIIGNYYPTWLSIYRNNEKLILDAGSWQEELNLFEDLDGNLVSVIKDMHLLKFKKATEQAPLTLDWLVFNGTLMYSIYHKNLEDADIVGANKSIWKQWVGNYHAYTWIQNEKIEMSISIVNGYIYVNDMRCKEFEEGLLRSVDGHVLDIRSDYVTFDNRRFLKND